MCRNINFSMPGTRPEEHTVAIAHFEQNVGLTRALPLDHSCSMRAIAAFANDKRVGD